MRLAALSGLFGLALVALLTGCGSHRSITTAELTQGRVLFQSGRPQSCGFCHTLAAADTTSTLGPALAGEMQEIDQRLKSNEALAQYVRGWIAHGACANPTDASRCMPAALFTGSAADAIAAFVAVCGRTPSHPGCDPKPGALQGDALRGEQLFQTRGCVSCHFSAGGIPDGPPLLGVAGSRVELADGKTVRADRAYLYESIASPNRQIVNGYQRGVMSAWVAPQHLTHAQINALVAYLETLR